MLELLYLLKLFQSLNKSHTHLPDNLADEILDMEEVYAGSIERVNKFKSIEEIEEYLKQETNNWYSKQLDRIQSEHNYASSSLTNVTSYRYNELSDEGYESPDEKNAVVVEQNLSSKVSNLRRVKKSKEGNCICCK